MKKNSAILGAAFLMATSAIGPGFLTQTTYYTEQLLASFGLVILISTLLDIGVQLNIWRILTMSGLRAQELCNKMLPGLGLFLAVLIVFGGLAFNIGNIAGSGLGLNVLLNMNVEYGAVISCMIALFIFWMKEASAFMDSFTKVLGIIMILLTLYVAISSQPPILLAVEKTFFPDMISATAIITLIGGTVGGYISFAGAHRLLDAGIKGPQHLPQVNRSAVSGIVITGVMRTILFLAALGVVSKGVSLDPSNPPASVFKLAAGEIGYKFFGIVMWAASITSVVGAAYTSVSFIKTLHPFILKNEKWFISFFILFSTSVFIFIGKPVKLLIAAGAINGIILPVALTLILLGSYHSKIMGDHKHPNWLKIVGWIITASLTYLSYSTIKTFLNSI